jgi:hypothetical protein
LKIPLSSATFPVAQGEYFLGLHPPFESNAMKKIVALLVLVACTASFAKKILDEPGNPPPVKTKKK